MNTFYIIVTTGLTDGGTPFEVLYGDDPVAFRDRAEAQGCADEMTSWDEHVYVVQAVQSDCTSYPQHLDSMEPGRVYEGVQYPTETAAAVAAADDWATEAGMNSGDEEDLESLSCDTDATFAESEYAQWMRAAGFGAVARETLQDLFEEWRRQRSESDAEDRYWDAEDNRQWERRQ